MAGTEERTGPLLLLDGMSLAFRAFFALPDNLVTSKGVVTNALHGFVSMVTYLVREHSPSGLAVAFDPPGWTFREDMVEGYKAGRDATPAPLPPQFDMIREVLGALGVPVIEVRNFEADDVLATLASEARDRGCDAIVVTGDRDTFQLVEDPHVRVLYNRRGVSDYSLYDEAGIIERCGVPPVQYVQLAAMRGDTSDNLPGIPGVGEKTAAKLLNQYGDLDGIYAHLDAMTPKLRQNLEENEALARSNAAVMPLVRDVPMDVHVDDLSLGGWDRPAAEALFADYELKTQWRRIDELLQAGAFGPPKEGTDAGPGVGSVLVELDGSVVEADGVAALVLEAREIAVPASASAAVTALGTLGEGGLSVAARWNGSPGRSELVGLLLVATEGEEAGNGVFVAGELVGAASVVKKLGSVLARPVVGHHVKEIMRSLLPLGIDLTGLSMDTAVAAYLLDASTGEYELETLREQSGQLQLDMNEGGDGGPDALVLGVAEAAASEARDVARMAAGFRRQLVAEGMADLHDDIETPLVRVLARMEVLGIGVDRPVLQGIADSLAEQAASLSAEVHELAGHEFNVNSTPQLRQVLYDEIGLTPGKKTKTGYSTDAQTLESLRGVHPIIEALLSYREVEKLRSTYGENLLAEVAEDGRIHASFGQTVARTGRISSDRPNLHNIPVRTEMGKQFRNAFVPAKGCSFLVADYNQIELRVIAHLSEDVGLIEAMTSGSDVHRQVASAVYDVPPEEVTKTQREFSKMVSYGLAYGMEAYGLSQRLGVAVDEAAAIMDSYFGAFPRVKAFMDESVVEAREQGGTRTLMGRIRPLPDLNSSNFRLRQAAERQAMNAGIQGLAADIFKSALVRLDRDLEEAALASRLVLQVHDEVIVEVAKGEETQVTAITETAMTSVVALGLPLTVSMASGPSWGAAKG